MVFVFLASAPESSIVARYGGEEFCILLHSANTINFSPYFEDLRKKIECLQVEHEGKRIPITVSVGVSDKTGNSLEEILDNADKLLYEAKERGRNRVVLAA